MTLNVKNVLTLYLLAPLFNSADAGKKVRQSAKNDPASQQLDEWAATHKIERATSENGIPVPSLTATLGIGTQGPLLLQDLNYQDHLASFASERTPERLVHAKGAGAYGHFIVTNPEICKYTSAKLFSKVGKKTYVVVRFSTVIGELGSPDSVQDLRGFAIKFFTQDGNYDLLTLSSPNFEIRDPMLFPSLIHSRKRNPSTHLADPNMFWDFTSARPETTFNTFLSMGDMGFPKNYRHMSTFAVSAFKFTGGKEGPEPVFIKYHFVTNQGKSLFTPDYYKTLSGVDPDAFNRDLYNAIANGDYPSWTLNIQIVTLQQLQSFKFNPFDATKIWPVKDYPMTPVGILTLTRNPKDYFNEVEQVAFNPGNLVPGIETSPDRLLQGRFFIYGSTQRHRIGKNHNQLPVNSPNPKKVHTYTRDGFMSIYANEDGGPNYYPNSFNGPVPSPSAQPSVYFTQGGDVTRFDSGDIDNYSQVDEYWRTEMSPEERNRTVKNIAKNLAAAHPIIQERSLERNWDPVSLEFSLCLRTELTLANQLKTRKAKQSQIRRKNLKKPNKILDSLKSK